MSAGVSLTPNSVTQVAIELNHTIISARHAEISARWLADLFGLPEPIHWGYFWQIETSNRVALDFSSADADAEFDTIHYAFLVSDDEFDEIFGRIVERGLGHWADPGRNEPGDIYHHFGGRGVYFLSNDGHLLEIMTRPYDIAVLRNWAP
jgi:catechol 2,3-dioxygenase-like lactoylglutathione lyase family enzyme